MRSSVYRRHRYDDNSETEPLVPAIPGPSYGYNVVCFL